jgi:archaeosine synthase alpha-subunit
MDELVLIINSGKCDWGRCLFCGWGKCDNRQKSLRELKDFLDTRLKRHKGVTWLKLFNSGSFLDGKQIHPAFRSYVIRKCEQLGIKNLVIESLPKFVTLENLVSMKSSKVKVHIAIGLEVADDKVLKKLGKGIMNKESYIKASGILHENKFYLRTYLIANPPFVKNVRKSLADSVKFARKYSDTIAICNLYPHSNSGLFNFWTNGKWKPLGRKEFDKVTKGLKAEIFFDNFVFKPQWKPEKQVKIKGATTKQLNHPYFNIWQDYVCGFFKPKEGKDIVLFVPCAFRKPYTSSKLHKAIMSVVKKVKARDRLHLVVVSTPGAVPIELCNSYPFNSYDWPEWEETAKVKREYVKVTQKRLENYLGAHKYKKYYCYFKPNAESFKALKQACKKLKIKLIDCTDEAAYAGVKYETNALVLPEMLDGLWMKLKEI